MCVRASVCMSLLLVFPSDLFSCTISLSLSLFTGVKRGIHVIRSDPIRIILNTLTYTMSSALFSLFQADVIYFYLQCKWEPIR